VRSSAALHCPAPQISPLAVRQSALSVEFDSHRQPPPRQTEGRHPAPAASTPQQPVASCVRRLPPASLSEGSLPGRCTTTNRRPSRLSATAGIEHRHLHQASLGCMATCPCDTPAISHTTTSRPHPLANLPRPLYQGIPAPHRRTDAARNCLGSHDEPINSPARSAGHCVPSSPLFLCSHHG
jgi:hypothetical protein